MRCVEDCARVDDGDAVSSASESGRGMNFPNAPANSAGFNKPHSSLLKDVKSRFITSHVYRQSSPLAFLPRTQKLKERTWNPVIAAPVRTDERTLIFSSIFRLFSSLIDASDAS